MFQQVLCDFVVPEVFPDVVMRWGVKIQSGVLLSHRTRRPIGWRVLVRWNWYSDSGLMPQLVRGLVQYKQRTAGISGRLGKYTYCRDYVLRLCGQVCLTCS